MIRTESHCYKKSTHNYNVFMTMARDAKLIYNAAQFKVRQKFIRKNKFLNYNAIDNYFKIAYKNRESMLYRLLGVPITQQIYKNVESEWLAYFAAVKEYKLNPYKFTGRPKMPNYSSYEYKTFAISNQTFVIANNKIVFRKPRKNSPHWVNMRPDSVNIHAKFDKIKQLRIIPKGSHVKLEIVYEIKDVIPLENNNRIMSIDPGMNNLLTCISNVKGFQPIIYNGKPLKSINQYYNKRKSMLTSIAKKSNNLYTTNRIDLLTLKRTRKITQYIHEVTKSVIATALSHEITTIVMGNGGTDSKRNIGLGSRVNQNFVSIPFSLVVDQLRYKSEQVGIRFLVVDESYTSGTSFLDNELPTKAFYDKSRRLSRGLFVTNSGYRINADVNGAYQIMKKVTPDIYDGVEGLVHLKSLFDLVK